MATTAGTMDLVDEPFKRKIRHLGISLERGTDAVPQDGRYHVLYGTEIRYSSANKALADAHFELLTDEIKAAHPELIDPKDVLAKERAFNDTLPLQHLSVPHQRKSAQVHR